jgi:hypothetical protein
MTEKPDQTGSLRDDWTEDHTGKGGVTGAPIEMEGVPDSEDVESHEVVSGGGVVEREELGPEESGEATSDLE